MEQFLEQLADPTLYSDGQQYHRQRQTLLAKIMSICRNDLVLTEEQIPIHSAHKEQLLTDLNKNKNTNSKNNDENVLLLTEDDIASSAPLLFSEAKDGAFSIIATLLELYTSLDDLEEMLKETMAMGSNGGGDADTADLGEEDDETDDDNADEKTNDNNTAMTTPAKRLWWGYKLLKKMNAQKKAQEEGNEKEGANNNNNTNATTTAIPTRFVKAGVAHLTAITSVKSNFFTLFADIVTIFSQHASVPSSSSSFSFSSSSSDKTKRTRTEGVVSNSTNKDLAQTNMMIMREPISLLDATGLMVIFEFFTMKLIELDEPIHNSMVEAMMLSSSSTASSSSSVDPSQKLISDLISTVVAGSSNTQQQQQQQNTNNASSHDASSSAAATSGAGGVLTINKRTPPLPLLSMKEPIDQIVRFRGLILLARALLVATTLNYGGSLSAIQQQQQQGGALQLPMSNKNAATSTSSSSGALSSTATTVNALIQKTLAAKEAATMTALAGGEGGAEAAGVAGVDEPEAIAALFTAADDARRRLIGLFRKSANTANASHLMSLHEELLVMLAGVEEDEEVAAKAKAKADAEAQEAAEAKKKKNNDDADDPSGLNDDSGEKEEEEPSSVTATKSSLSSSFRGGKTNGIVTNIPAHVKESLRRVIVARLLHYKLYHEMIRDIGSVFLSDLLDILVRAGGSVLHISSLLEDEYTHDVEDPVAFLIEDIVAPRTLLCAFFKDSSSSSYSSSCGLPLLPLSRARVARQPILHFGDNADYLRPIENIIPTKEGGGEEEGDSSSADDIAAVTLGVHPIASFIIDSLSRNINDSLRLFIDSAVESGKNAPSSLFNKLIVALEKEMIPTGEDAAALAAAAENEEENDGTNNGSEEEEDVGARALRKSTAFFKNDVTPTSVFELFAFASNPLASSALPALVTLSAIIRPQKQPTNTNNNTTSSPSLLLLSPFALVSPLRILVAARLVALSSKAVAALQYLFNDTDMSTGAIGGGGGNYYNNRNNNTTAMLMKAAASEIDNDDNAAVTEIGASLTAASSSASAAPVSSASVLVGGRGAAYAVLLHDMVLDTANGLMTTMMLSSMEEKNNNATNTAAVSAAALLLTTLQQQQQRAANTNVALSGLSHRSFLLFSSVFWVIAMTSVLTSVVAWLHQTHSQQPPSQQTAGRRQQLAVALERLGDVLRVDCVIAPTATAAASTITTTTGVTATPAGTSTADQQQQINNATEGGATNGDAVMTPAAAVSQQQHFYMPFFARQRRAAHDNSNTNALVSAAANDGEDDNATAIVTAGTAVEGNAAVLDGLSQSLDIVLNNNKKTAINNNNIAAANDIAAQKRSVAAPYAALPMVALWFACGFAVPSTTLSLTTPSSTEDNTAPTTKKENKKKNNNSLHATFKTLMTASVSAIRDSFAVSAEFSQHTNAITTAKAPRAHIYNTSAGKMTITAIVDSIILSLQNLKVQKSALFVDYSKNEKRLKLKESCEGGIAIGARTAAGAIDMAGGEGVVGAADAANNNGNNNDPAATTAAALRNPNNRSFVKESEDAAAAEPTHERGTRSRILRTALSEYAQIHIIDHDPETPLNENLLRWLHTLGRNTTYRRAAYVAQRREIRRINGLDIHGNPINSSGGVGGGLLDGTSNAQQQHVPLGQMIHRLQTGMFTIQKTKDAMANIHPRARLHQAAFGSLLRGFHRLASSGASEAALRQAQSLVSRCLAHSPLQVKDRCEDMLCAYLNEAIMDCNHRQRMAVASAFASSSSSINGAAAAASSSSLLSPEHAANALLASIDAAAAAAAAAGGGGASSSDGSSFLSSSSSAVAIAKQEQLYKGLLSPFTSQRSVLSLCIQCLYTSVAQSATARSAAFETLSVNGGGASSSSGSNGGVVLATNNMPATTSSSSAAPSSGDLDIASGAAIDPAKPLHWILTKVEEQAAEHATFLATVNRQQQQHHTSSSNNANGSSGGGVDAVGSKRPRSNSSSSSTTTTATTTEIPMTSLQSAALFEADESRRGNRFSVLSTRILATMLNWYGGDDKADFSSIYNSNKTHQSSSSEMKMSPAAIAAAASYIPVRAFFDFIDACPMITNFMWTFWHRHACLNNKRAKLGMHVLCHIAQTRPAYRGRAIASLLYLSTVETSLTRHAAITKLRDFVTSDISRDYVSAEEMEMYRKVLVDYCLNQCDLLSEIVKSVAVASANPDYNPRAADSSSSSASGGSGYNAPFVLSTNLSLRQKARFHLLSDTKIAALEAIMTFDYDNPQQGCNAITEHHLNRLKLLQQWSTQPPPSVAAMRKQFQQNMQGGGAGAAPSSSSAAAAAAAQAFFDLHSHTNSSVSTADAFAFANNSARDIIDQHLSLFNSICRVDVRHAEKLIRRLLDLYGECATLSGAVASTIDAIAKSPASAAAAFAAGRQSNNNATTADNNVQNNVYFALQRLVLGTSLCSAILSSPDLDDVLRSLFGRVSSNYSVETTASPADVTIDFSQQLIFASRILPVVRRSPPAASDLAIKIMSASAVGIRAFMTELAQMAVPLSPVNQSKLGSILTLVATHCKWMFAHKPSLGAMAPPTIAPTANSNNNTVGFSTQLFGAAFGHANPISISATTMTVNGTAVAAYTSNHGMDAATLHLQQQTMPTVSPAVIASVAALNKRLFDNDVATAAAFNQLLVSPSPTANGENTNNGSNATPAMMGSSPFTIPSDIRFVLPILGLVDRSELREIFVPAFVRFFAATEALRMPVEAPKMDFIRNLIGAEQIRLSSSATTTASSFDQQQQQQHQAPYAYLSLLQGSAAIVDVSLQECLWNMLVPADIPPIAPRSSDGASATSSSSSLRCDAVAIVDPTAKRGIGTLDFVTEVMMVCNRVRRGAPASSNPANAAAIILGGGSGNNSNTTDTTTATTSADHHPPAHEAYTARLSQFDALLFGPANGASHLCGSRLLHTILTRRTRPTFMALTAANPNLVRGTATINILNELLLMSSVDAAASEYAYSWFDRKLGQGASPYAAALLPHHHHHHFHHNNAMMNRMGGGVTQLMQQHTTNNAAISPVAPFAVAVPQGLLLGSLELFKNRMRRCPDIYTAAGISVGGLVGNGVFAGALPLSALSVPSAAAAAAATATGMVGATPAGVVVPTAASAAAGALNPTASAAAAALSSVNAYIEGRALLIEQYLLEWVKGLSSHLTRGISQASDTNPYGASSALLTQQYTLLVAPLTIAPAAQIATVAGPTVNKMLIHVTGRQSVTATAFPPLEALLKAVDISTLYDRFQRVPNIAPSHGLAANVSGYWGKIPIDLMWLAYSALHLTAIRLDPNYSEPLRERGVRAIADAITDASISQIVTCPHHPLPIPTNPQLQQAVLKVLASQPMECSLLLSWALLFCEEHWARVEAHLTALPDKRLLELLQARPKLQQIFIASHERSPQYTHLLQQLRGGGGVE